MQEQALKRFFKGVVETIPVLQTTEFSAMMTGFITGAVVACFIYWLVHKGKINERNNTIKLRDIAVSERDVVIAGHKNVIDLLDRQKVELESKVKMLPEQKAIELKPTEEREPEEQRIEQPQVTFQWNSYLLTKVKGKIFTSETIQLDGYEYDNCRFENVTFEYEGAAPFRIVNSIVRARTVIVKSSHPIVNHTQHLIHDLYTTSGYTKK